LKGFINKIWGLHIYFYANIHPMVQEDMTMDEEMKQRHTNSQMLVIVLCFMLCEFM
jgi:hypothetical protein